MAGRIGWPRLGENVTITSTVRRATGSLASEQYGGISWSSSPAESGVYDHTDPALFPARATGSYVVMSDSSSLKNDIGIVDVTNGSADFFVASNSILSYEQTFTDRMFIRDFKKVVPLPVGRSYAYTRAHGTPSGTTYGVWLRSGVNYGRATDPYTDDGGRFTRAKFVPSGAAYEGPEYGWYDLRPIRSPDAVRILASGASRAVWSANTINVTCALAGSTADTKRGVFVIVGLGQEATGAAETQITLNGNAPTITYPKVINGVTTNSKASCQAFFWDYNALSVISGSATLTVTLPNTPSNSTTSIQWMECTNVADSGHAVHSGVPTGRVGTVTSGGTTWSEFAATLDAAPVGDVLLANCVVENSGVTMSLPVSATILSPRGGDSSWICPATSATMAYVDPLGAIGTSNVMGFCSTSPATSYRAVGMVMLPKRWEQNTVIIPVSTSEKVRHFVSHTLGATPPAGRLAGEMAFNLADKRMWVYDSVGNPVEIV